MTMALRGNTQKSIKAYEREYNAFFSFVNKGVVDIKYMDIQRYLGHYKIVRKNKDITINNKIRYLRGLFNWLTEEEYIPKNPMVKVKENKVEHRVKEVFKDEEVVIIRDVAVKKSLRDIAIVDFLYETGVRISEMLALNRDDINVIDRECIVYGKGRKERQVNIGIDAVVHLKDYLESRTDSNPALFVSLKHPFSRITDDGVRAMMNSLSERDVRLKGVKINPHKWRRQFVTELLEKDVPLHLVAEMIGHVSVDTTNQSYANCRKNKSREAHRKYIV